MPSGGGLHHRMVRGLEPGRGLGTLLYGVIAVVLVGVLTFDRFPQWRPVALPRVDVPDLAFWFAVLFAAVAVFATVFNARRWSAQRRVVRMSRDPALRSVLPAVETDPSGPFAPPQQPPEVCFDRTPRLFARIPARHRVKRGHNVVGRPPLRIVYLRVFDNRPRSRTFARGAWREFGYVHILRSAASVAPGEFARYRRADRLAELFVSSEEQLRRQLDEAPVEPQPPGLRWLPTIAGSAVLTFDRYGAYPVRSALCHGDFWTTALDVLLQRADLVVLDLSGYHQRFRGTQFEVQRIVDTVPVEKVLLLADPASSRRFLREQIRLAWERMATGSPNVGGEQKRVQGYVTDWYFDEVDERGSVTRRTLRASRTQSRWLLARTQERLGVRPAPLPPERPDPQGPGGAGPSGEPSYPPPPARGVAASALVPVLVAALVAVLVAALVIGPFGLGIAGSGTNATVVPGSGYNVRSGPSSRFPESAPAVVAGEHVVVDCMQGEWARLREPAPGGYVHKGGLDIVGDPPDCGSG